MVGVRITKNFRQTNRGRRDGGIECHIHTYENTSSIYFCLGICVCITRSTLSVR